MEPPLGVFWIFGPAPSNRTYWLCGAFALGMALGHWGARLSWTASLLVTGLLAVILLPWLLPLTHGLGVAVRHWMACSRLKAIRRLAKCEVLMVGYCRWPNGNIKYGRVMSFDRLLELSPEQARSKIRAALIGLQDDSTPVIGQSIDDALSEVYSYVEARRSPLRWKVRHGVA